MPTPNMNSSNPNADPGSSEKTKEDLQLEFGVLTDKYARFLAEDIDDPVALRTRKALREQYFSVREQLADKALEEDLEEAKLDPDLVIGPDWYKEEIEGINNWFDQTLQQKTDEAQQEMIDGGAKGFSRTVGESAFFRDYKEGEKLRTVKKVLRGIGHAAVIGTAAAGAVTLAGLTLPVSGSLVAGALIGAGAGATLGAVKGVFVGAGRLGEVTHDQRLKGYIENARGQLKAEEIEDAVHGRTLKEIAHEIEEAEAEAEQIAAAKAILQLGVDRQRESIDESVNELRKDRRRNAGIGRAARNGAIMGMLTGALAGLAPAADIAQEGYEAPSSSMPGTGEGGTIEANVSPEGSDVDVESANETLSSLGITEGIEWGSVDMEALGNNPLVEYDAKTGELSLSSQDGTLADYVELADVLGVNLEDIQLSDMGSGGESAANELLDIYASDAEAARDIVLDEGPYNTFQEMGIPESEWEELYRNDELMRKLIANGDAYSLLESGDQSYGWGWSHAGEVSDASIRDIYEAVNMTEAADTVTSGSESVIAEDTITEAEKEAAVDEIRQSTNRDIASMGLEFSGLQMSNGDELTPAMVDYLVGVEGSGFEYNSDGTLTMSGEMTPTAREEITSYLGQQGVEVAPQASSEVVDRLVSQLTQNLGAEITEIDGRFENIEIPPERWEEVSEFIRNDPVYERQFDIGASGIQDVRTGASDSAIQDLVDDLIEREYVRVVS